MLRGATLVGNIITVRYRMSTSKGDYIFGQSGFHREASLFFLLSMVVTHYGLYIFQEGKELPAQNNQQHISFGAVRVSRAPSLLGALEC